MDRRVFVIGSTLGLLIGPRTPGAQPASSRSKIGVFAPFARRAPVQDVFEQSLRGLGWINGQNLTIEVRAPTGPGDTVARVVADLVSLDANVLVVWGTVGALAAKQSTNRIPVVFLATGDPISLGLVTSLAHPGGNLTGVPAIASSEEFPKRLALLKEVVPSIGRVAVLVGPDGRTLWNLNRQPMMAAASALRLELQELPVETDSDLEPAVRKAKRQGAQALYVWPSSLTLRAGKQLSDFALTASLPSVHPFSESAVAGGLLSYAASLTDIARRGAVYVDKILKGAKPSDLPVEQPTKFELVINLKTAKALRLTIPQSLLVRADEIIQ
jgi:putative ABC transport system substrate-binding protein